MSFGQLKKVKCTECKFEFFTHYDIVICGSCGKNNKNAQTVNTWSK